MNDWSDGDSPAPLPAPLPASAPSLGGAQVLLGQAMPDLSLIPTLQAVVAPAAQPPANTLVEMAPGARRSHLAEGLDFEGSAQVRGSLTVSGAVQGRLQASDRPDAEGQITVSETGVVRGDILARNIAVFGQTDGLLDASGGRVSLHGSAVVAGHIRYTHLQVNGADLNAQLERVRPDGESAATRR